MKAHFPTPDRRVFSAWIACAAVILGARAAHAADAEVDVDPSLSKFVPDSITIKAGDTVTWTNGQIVSHSVTFDPGQAKKAGDAALPAGVAPFDSGEMQQDQTFKHQFTVKGTYKYFCKFHEDMGMVGTVVVS